MKGENLILHIGYPRTGTTWLQEEFFPQVENYKYRRHIRSIILGKEKLVDFPKNLIMSDEEIVNIRIFETPPSGPSDIYPNYSYIIENYKKVKIVVFIRNQKTLIGSAYSFLSQSNRYDNFDHFFYYVKKLKYKQLQYYSFLNFFEDFPNSKLYIYLFEDFINNPVSTIKKIADELEITIDLNKINFRKKNSSPPSLFIPAIIALNKIHPFFGKKLFSLTQQFPGKRFKIPDKYIEEINNLFAKENELLDRKYNLGMKRYNYY